MSDYLLGFLMGVGFVLLLEIFIVSPRHIEVSREKLIAACINDNYVIVNEVVYECDAQEMER